MLLSFMERFLHWNCGSVINNLPPCLLEWRRWTCTRSRLTTSRRSSRHSPLPTEEVATAIEVVATVKEVVATVKEVAATAIEVAATAIEAATVNDAVTLEAAIMMVASALGPVTRRLPSRLELDMEIVVRASREGILDSTVALVEIAWVIEWVTALVSETEWEETEWEEIEWEEIEWEVIEWEVIEWEVIEWEAGRS